MITPSTGHTYRADTCNLAVVANRLSETWSPRVAAQINDVLVKVARFNGDFVWHNHPDTDEAFLCLSGSISIDVRDKGNEQHRRVTLNPGDFFVVPRGIHHRPQTDGDATVALFEAAGVVNTGNAGSELTAPVDLPLDR